ncbi:MAG: EAL domain-containing response regulator [Zoogloeaceae bacterium]|nr:EAL domain-containing response regulator [Zoogloeaceae bacterium]
MSEARLLVLDDDAAVADMIQFIAEDAGLEVRVTLQAQDFFEQLAAWGPTHLAIDLVMPGMDGVEVMGRLASLGCTARVIITSGVGSRVLDSARRFAAEHALDVIGVVPKPFSPSALRNLLLSDDDPAREAALRGSGGWSGTLEITEGELQRALDRREFRLAYQPKIECASGRLAGFETLVRWEHPRVGTIMPDRFIEPCERFDLIDRLTDSVIDGALAWFGEAFRGRDEHLSVNLSARCLKDPSLGERIARACAQAALDPGRVILELTETSAMEDPTSSLGLLTRLRVKGFQLSIDDFGTGYSSMVELVRLPFSEMKVDKSFVMAHATSAEARAVIRSIVELGHSLGLKVTAEGVEDAAALDFLREAGCDYAQGFFIARPMPAQALLDWIAARA